MLVPAPYSQAYFGFIPKGNEVKEKTADLYLVFTRGPKAIVKGFEGTSQDIKLGFERSKQLAKQGYACALHGISYSYEKGKEGFYYVKIAKERTIPVLSDAESYASSVIEIPTTLPVFVKNRWYEYLETTRKRADAKFREALGSGGMCVEENHTVIVTDFATTLPLLTQSQWLNYLARLTASSATRFDKALDEKYLWSFIGGYNHRLFDGRHTIGGAWSSVARMCSKDGCSTGEQINGYFGALWKDATTPKGLPFMTMEKETYDSLADRLSKYGVSRKWTYDALSYDALEVIAAGMSVAAVVYFLRTGQIEELSEALGAMGVLSIASANPLLALVMISSVAYAIATGTDLDAVAAIEGVVKSSIISGAFVLLPGAFLLQITAALAVSILLEENMKDENYNFVGDYAMEKIGDLKAWIPDIQTEKNLRRFLYVFPKSLETQPCFKFAS